MFSIIKNGFTLVELIVTAAVLAIIAAIALPAFQHYMAEQEVQSTVAKLIMANRSARNLALLHHANVVICPSEGLAQCEPAKWSRGFIVFTDLNKNRQADAGESILQTEALGLQYGTLDWKGALSMPSVTFQALSGLPIGSNGSFYYCSLADLPHQKIIMSKMAQIRVEHPSAC